MPFSSQSIIVCFLCHALFLTVGFVIRHATSQMIIATLLNKLQAATVESSYEREDEGDCEE